MISKEKWAEVVKDFHEKGIPQLVKRELSIPKKIPLKRAISIIGPRRAGKTYTMFQLIEEIVKDGISINRTIYINLERTDLEDCNSKDLMAMMETYYEMYPENKKRKTWLFLDEIQNVGMWENFVRTVIDSENVQVFISGSSSKLLSKEIATALRGRTITYTILPFSFKDYLAAENMESRKYLSTSEKASLINALKTYMEKGGYPEAIIYKKESERILTDIVETTMYRDVVERYGVRNTRLLKLLIQSLINSSQREFSVHKFYNYTKSTGMKVSKTTLYNYMNALADVFLIFLLRKYSTSLREAEQSIPKVYVVDNGILILSGVNDFGKLLENLVFLELTRRNKNVYYYKSIDNKEVDFVIVEKGKVSKILQVAYSLDDFATKEREIKSLLKASRELKCNSLSILTWSKEGEETTNGKKITYIPLWKWLVFMNR